MFDVEGCFTQERDYREGLLNLCFYPPFGEDVWGGGIDEPFFRHNNCFLRIGVQPCSPPAKCAVADDIVGFVPSLHLAYNVIAVALFAVGV